MVFFSLIKTKQMCQEDICYVLITQFYANKTNKQTTNQINKIGSSACLKVKLTVDMIPCGITSTHCPLVVTLRNYTNLLRQIRHDNITKLVKQRPVNAFKINL